MILSELPAAELARRMGGEGLAVQCGPFAVRVLSSIPAVNHGLARLYADHPLLETDAFADIEMRLVRRGRLGPFVAPQVMLDLDGEHPFTPLPLAHAFPFFEWALNWSIASSANQYLILHAAVVEQGGRALIMPGPPGSGKSTLSAALTAGRWRLLSDELTLVDTECCEVVPVPRPISLKNQSIALVRRHVPGAVLSEVTHNTFKGSVAHLKVPSAHVQRASETAKPGWIVFPKYAAGAASRLEPRSKANTVLELANNSFNYHIQGRQGFEVLADMVEASGCYDFEYSDLDEAVAILDRMARTRS